MAWLQIHQTLKDHRKLLKSADLLNIEPPHMMGILVSLWLWAIDNAPDGKLEEISPRIIARAAQWSGDPELLIEALKASEWLDECQTEDTLEIHDWEDYAGKLIEQRISERERSRKRRAKKSKKPEDDQQTTGGRPADDQQTTAGRVEKSRVDKSRVDKEIKDSKGDKPPEEPADENSKREAVPYKKIQEIFIETCPSFSKIMAINGQRKKAVGARWNEHKDIEVFKALFEKAEASSFMKGRNERNWTADFDWMMKPTNFSKVLEGRYDDKGGTGDGVNSRLTESEAAGTGETQTATLTGFKMATEPEQ